MVFGMDEKAQVSAELIIVIAALIAVAVVLVTQLQNSAKKGVSKLGEKTTDVLYGIDDIQG